MMHTNDFWVGLRCGYPLCCVLFFCDVWCDLYEIIYYENPKRFNWNWKHGIGHIQCPECIIGNMTHIPDLSHDTF